MAKAATRATKARAILEEMGVTTWDAGDHANIFFRISGENNYNAHTLKAKLWASYDSPEFGTHGVCQEIADVLKAHDLDFEWNTPGDFHVYEM